MENKIKSKVRKFNKITFVVKLTNFCDSDCQYCYHKYKMPDDPKAKLDYNLFKESLQKVLNATTDGVSIHFHGGEPLSLSPYELEQYFIIANDIKNNSNKRVTLCIQSNILHLNKEKLDLINKYGISLSTSYDSLSYCNNRCSDITEWQEKYNLYMTNQKETHQKIDYLGLINVVTSDSIKEMDKIIEDIENLDGNNVMSNPAAAFSSKNDNIILKPGEFAQFTIKRFEYQWKHNKKISTDTGRWLLPLLNMRSTCHTSICLNSVLTLTPTGILKGCDMRNEDHFLYCNIKDIEKLEDLFEVEKYKKLEKAYIELHKRCSSCEVYNYCNAGCFNLSSYFYDDDGNLVLSKFAFCEDVKILIKYFSNFLNNVDIDTLPNNFKKSIFNRK